MLIKVNTRGAAGFFEWMKRALPETYKGVTRELQGASRLSGAAHGAGLGTTLMEPVKTATEAPVSSSLANTIREISQVVGQVYLTREQMKAQQQILNVQLQRAQQGLAPLPIDPSTYGLPQPSFGVSLDAGTKQLLMWGGIGLAVAVLFGLIGGGRAARPR